MTSRSFDGDQSPVETASAAQQVPIPKSEGNTGVEEEGDDEQEQQQEGGKADGWEELSPEDRRTMIMVSAMDKLIDKIERMGSGEKKHGSRKPLQKIPTGTGKDKLPSIKAWRNWLEVKLHS